MSEPVLVSTPVEIVENADQDRFEIWITEPERVFVGFLGYERTAAGAYDLLHTIIKEEFGRQGYARTLVTHVLDRLRAAGATVVVTCSYVARYLERFPQYRDLVSR